MLSEFQVWAAVKPAGQRYLRRAYRTYGRSHNFMLMSNRWRYWDADRIMGLIDEVRTLKAFNLVTIGDDHGADRGHLFGRRVGVRRAYRAFLHRVFQYTHERGLLAGVEPRNIPYSQDWTRQWDWWWSLLDPALGARAPDVVKLSLEWVGGYQHRRNLVLVVDTILRVIRRMNPRVLVYVDSIGWKWRRVRRAHRYLLQEHPRLLLGLHAGNAFTGKGRGTHRMIRRFRRAGFRNLMLQINPNEGSQWFYYWRRTRKAVAVFHRAGLRYVSFAGANLGYDRQAMLDFLRPLRPRLALARTVGEVRATLQRQQATGRRVSLRAVRRQELWTLWRYVVGPLHSWIVGEN